MTTQTPINDKISSLNQQADQIMERAKILKAEAKLAAQVKEQFPDAQYTVQPNGSSGFVTRSINAQTHGVVRRHVYTKDPNFGDKKFAYYYELVVKIGKQKVVMTSDVQGWMNTNDILIILDAACAQKGRKAKAPVETEVTPTVRTT